MLASSLIPLAYCNDLRLISSFTLLLSFRNIFIHTTHSYLWHCLQHSALFLPSSKRHLFRFSASSWTFNFCPLWDSGNYPRCNTSGQTSKFQLDFKHPLYTPWTLLMHETDHFFLVGHQSITCMQRSSSSAFKHLFTSLLPLLHLQHLFISYMQHFTPPLTEQLVFCAASNQFSV